MLVGGGTQYHASHGAFYCDATPTLMVVEAICSMPIQAHCPCYSDPVPRRSCKLLRNTNSSRGPCYSDSAAVSHWSVPTFVGRRWEVIVQYHIGHGPCHLFCPAPTVMEANCSIPWMSLATRIRLPWELLSSDGLCYSDSAAMGSCCQAMDHATRIQSPWEL